MSRSRKTSHSEIPEEYWVGHGKPEVNIIRGEEMHWTEQLRLRVKDTRVRPPLELGDRDPRIDQDMDDNDNFKETQ